MSLYIIFSVLFVHWFSDFVIQTDKEAKGKSSDNRMLLNHTVTYTVVSMVLLIGLNVLNTLVESIIFLVITFVFHTLTDYFTSRLNAKLWAKGDVHNFFVSVGFDQVLHYIQLFLTLYFIL